MSKARNLSNLVVTDNSVTIPAGTTEERPTSPAVGMMRYNTTTGYFESYSASGWASIATPPSIASVSPTTYNGESGTTFTINGSFFDSTSLVKFITSQGIEYSAATVGFINSSQLTATTPQDFTIANEPLNVKVINGAGLAYTLTEAIDCGGSPVWSTASGTIATINDDYGSYSPIATVVASDPDAGSSISYSISSGTIPAGTTLNSSTGAISGNPDNVSNTTTNNFIIAATDNAGNSTTRSFNIIVNPSLDGLSSARAATSAQSIKTLTGTTTSGGYWIKHPSGYTTQYETYCDMSTLGGGWMLAWVVTNAQGDTQYWFDNDSSMASPLGTPNWFTADSTNNLQIAYGNSLSNKQNVRMPAFTSYSFNQMMIRENYNGSIRYKGYTLDTTQTFQDWFVNTSDHATYTNRVSSIIGTSGDTMSAGSSSFSSNTLDFNVGLSVGMAGGDGARLASTPPISEATGGISGRVDGARGYTWKGNLTRDDTGRVYSNDGTTTDHTVYIFVR